MDIPALHVPQQLYLVGLCDGQPEALPGPHDAGERVDLASMLNLGSILGVLGAIVVAVTAFFTVRRFLHWFRPVRIRPSVRIVFDRSGPDQVLATVTNISGEDQVLVECKALSAYTIRAALLKHIRHPFVPPRLYPTIWRSAVCFGLMGDEPIRIAPKGRVQLSHALSDHPLSVFLTPKLQVEAELSDGRLFRSKRIDVPERWRLHSTRQVT